MSSTRLLGFGILLIALAMIAWSELLAQPAGRYSVKLVLLGPLFAVMAIGILIHAPELPITSVTLRDTLYACMGVALGLLNLHRHGAFAPGSYVGWFLVAGLVLAAAFLAVSHVRK